MDIFLKAIIGALVVVAMGIVSKSKFYFITQIMFFVIFVLVTYFMAGQDGKTNLKNIVLFGMLLLILNVVINTLFILSNKCFFLSYKFSLYINLFLPTLIGFITVFLTYFIYGLEFDLGVKLIFNFVVYNNKLYKK